VSAERGEPFTWQHLAFWDDAGGGLAIETTKATLPTNDMTAGSLIIVERPDELHYVAEDEQWYAWDGTCHRPEPAEFIRAITVEWARRLKQMLRYAKAAVFERVRAEVGLADPNPTEARLKLAFQQAWEGWKAAESYCASLMKTAGMRALEMYMRALCLVEHTMFDFNHAAELLNCKNGTVDLRTGAVRRHNPQDMITYCLDVEYNPKARATIFWRMINRMCADWETAAYFLKVLGYSLLGDNREQRIVFINGPTGSGKSQVLGVVSDVLGDLVHESVSELITHVRHGRNARTENSIRGARLVCIAETSTAMRIDEGQLKRLTGEPVLSVNQHYAKMEIKTPVTWLIMVATNHLPSVPNYDGAIERRMLVIPGGPSLEASEMDQGIRQRVLASEREGVLALLVAGCMEYFRSGLGDPPTAVELAGLAYKDEQDTTSAFVRECCELTAHVGLAAADWKTGASQLWSAYKLWASGGAYLGRNEFYAALAAHGLRFDRNNGRFHGVRLTQEWSAKVI
jgi:P4 family phage/plasmid primase-like protien